MTGGRVQIVEQAEPEVIEWLGKHRPLIRVERIPGDASTRRYYRVYTPQGNLILMRMENFAEQGFKLPFISVQNHLKQSGVDVPEVFEVDPDGGYILLEDLGDITLLRKLQDVSDMNVERHLYEQVIDRLVELHSYASPERATRDIAGFHLSFDYEKLMWEVNFTVEHFYETHLKRELSTEDRAVIDTGFGGICKELAAEPTVFTHRDFHSRNVMAAPPTGEEGGRERMVMIDFQDARMGPKQYDLASLLKDSYYQLAEEQISRLIDYYIARWEAISGEQLDRAHFIRIFDLMAIQRNFKAIGSFASFLNKRGNATYLKYVGNTFENIRRTLLKYPELSRLREVLFHHYYF